MLDAPARAIVRIVLIIVGVAITLYLLWLLRQPIGWLVLATFIAVALSVPVNALNRHMPRGLAIALVYLGMLLVPVALGAVVIPPFIDQANQLADNVPQYVADTREFVRENDTLRGLEEDYQIIDKLEEQARRLPERIDDAAVVLGNIGLGVVNSLFALVTILILAAFMLSRGHVWIEQALALQPPDRRVRLRRVLDRIGEAIANYVGGALLQATIAGLLAYIVLTILGVDFRAALALLFGVFSLIPLVGATIAAVIVGVVTLFTDFPTATIAWTIWAIVYQQIENNLIQPQIQRRAVDVQPFLVLVAVLFGATLLGVVGAVLAIPAAASIQIIVKEWWDYTHGVDNGGDGDGGGAGAPAGPDAPAGGPPAPAESPS